MALTPNTFNFGDLGLQLRCGRYVVRSVPILFVFLHPISISTHTLSFLSFIYFLIDISSYLTIYPLRDLQDPPPIHCRILSQWPSSKTNLRPTALLQVPLNLPTAATSKIHTCRAALPLLAVLLLRVTTSKLLPRWATLNNPFPPARALILPSKVPTASILLLKATTPTMINEETVAALAVVS